MLLRRTAANVGHAPSLGSREVLLPVPLAKAQAAMYRTLLTRQYELLTDPRAVRCDHLVAQGLSVGLS